MKLIFCSILTLSSLFTIAQSAYEEIEAARLKTLSQLQNKNYDAITLKTLIGDNSYYHLSMREQEWLLLFQKKYKESIMAIEEHGEFMYLEGYYRITDNHKQQPSMYRYVVQEKNDSLAQFFKKHFNTHKDDLINEVRYSDLTDEDELFLIYYIYFSDYQIDVCDAAKQRISIDKAQHLKRIYPDSKHLKFINNYSSHFREPSNFGYTVSLGIGYGALTDGLKEHFEMKLHMSMLLSLAYKKLDLGLVIPLSRFETKTPFQGVNEYFEEGRGVSSFSYAFYLGYNFHLAKKVTFNPFLGSSFNSVNGLYKNDEEFENMDFKRMNTVGLFYGFNLDFGSKKLECENNFQHKNFKIPNTAPFIRLQAGVMDPNLTDHVSELTGNHLFFSLGFGFYSRSVKRTKSTEL